MSAHPETASAALPAPKAGAALGIGIGGMALTAAGLFVAGPRVIAMSWLVALGYWTAIALGMLLLVILHHMFDASWSTVIRRQFEHGLAAFPLAFRSLPALAAGLVVLPTRLGLELDGSPRLDSGPS